MKKFVLCVMIVTLCVSAAFGGAVQDLLNEMMSKSASSKSQEQAMAEVKAIMTPDRIKAVISSGDDINAKGEQGVTLLMIAVASKNNEAVKALINAGADVNAKNEGENTILMWAIERGNPEIVRMLVNAGADITPMNQFHNTARSYALESENPEIRDMADTLLLTSNDAKSLLPYSIDSDTTPERVKTLIKAGADVNAKDDIYGTTATALRL